MANSSDLDLMENPDDWADWPYLNLKHVDGQQVGVLFDNGLSRRHEYYFVPKRVKWELSTYSEFLGVEPEDLISQGWTVDNGGGDV